MEQESFKRIDVGNWSRKTVYENFIGYSMPVFSIGVRLDVTNLYNRCKKKGKSFFIDFLYVIMKCINSTDGLKFRIYNGEVVLFDTVKPSFIVLADDGLIVTCMSPMHDNYEEFYDAVQNNIIISRKNAANKKTFNSTEKNDCIYISTLRWVDIANVTNAYDFKNVDNSSIPRVTWGKYVEENSRMKMSFNIAAHHALVDGEPICEILNIIQESLDNLSLFDNCNEAVQKK